MSYVQRLGKESVTY